MIGKRSVTSLLCIGLLGTIVLYAEADPNQHFQDLVGANSGTMSYEFFDGLLESLQARLPILRECFNHEKFHDIVDHGSQLTINEFINISRALTNIIAEKECSGNFDFTRIPHAHVIVENLRNLSYLGVDDSSSCFSEFSLNKESGDGLTTAVILYIYRGYCLLPEKEYFTSQYYGYFSDSGNTSSEGINSLLRQLGIGEKRSHDDHEGHDHEGEDSHDDHDHDTEGDNHDDHDHDTEVDNHDDHDHDTEVDNHDDHDHDTEDDHHSSNETDSHDDHDHGTEDDHHSSNETDHHDDQDHGTEDDHHSGNETDSHDDHDHGTEDDHHNGNETDHHDDHDHGTEDDHHSSNETDSHDDHDHGTEDDHHSSNETDHHDDHDESTEEEDDHDHAHSRKKRTTHVDGTTRCFTGDQLMEIYEVEGTISESKALEICPAIIQQIISGACNATEETTSTNNAAYTQAMIYGYGTASVMIISLLALLGMFLFPVLQTKTYKLVMQFFLGLAIGTMSSDALIHIIPNVLGIHDHGAHDAHDHAASEEDMTFVWQMSLIFGGLYAVFLFENSLKVMKKCRNMKKSDDTVYENVTEINDGSGNTSDGPGKEMTSFYDLAKSDGNLGSKMENDLEEGPRKEEVIFCNFTATLVTVFIGDVLHNFADGVALGVAFASHWTTGISTSIAIICHELPHELGDFAIYLRNGASKWRAIGLNFAAACCAFIGLYSGINMASDEDVRRWLLCIIAGIFLYISLVQVMAIMLKEKSERPALQFFIQNLGMLVGWAILLLIALYEDQIRVTA